MSEVNPTNTQEAQAQGLWLHEKTGVVSTGGVGLNFWAMNSAMKGIIPVWPDEVLTKGA